MKKLLYLSVLILTVYSVPASAVRLKWDMSIDDRLEMVRTAKVRFLVNNRQVKRYDERNIVDLTCYDKSKSLSKIRGLFSVYQKNPGTKVYNLMEQHPADFYVEKTGRLKVDNRYYMPNLRHIPTFPEKDIIEGDKWSAKGELMLNNFSVRFKLIFDVNYELLEISKKGSKRTAAINYNFLINKDLSRGRYPADFPVKILGKDSGTIKWDIDKNRPLDVDEKYRILFIFRSGRKRFVSNEFQMIINTKSRVYSRVTREDREKAKKELQKQIPEDSGIAVDTEKRGLVLRLGDVLFDFDSSKLKKDSRKKLDRAIDIIKKKYPDREIIVEGHTDNIGNRKYNSRLSGDRARGVAEYMKSRTGHDKLSYRGFASDKPIADNRTKKGRRKNRRVEIIIKLN